MTYFLIGSDLLMAAVFLLRFSYLPPQVPLFYSMPWGEQQLADSWTILLLPLFLNLLFLFNNFICRRYFLGNSLVQKIFNVLNILLSVSLTLIFVRIILLIT